MQMPSKRVVNSRNISPVFASKTTTLSDCTHPESTADTIHVVIEQMFRHFSSNESASNAATLVSSLHTRIRELVSLNASHANFAIENVDAAAIRQWMQCRPRPLKPVIRHFNQ
jgi:hypothetical protein